MRLGGRPGFFNGAGVIFFCFFFELEMAVVDGLGVVLDAAAAAASRARFAAYRRWRVFVEGAMVGERKLSGNVSAKCLGIGRSCRMICVMFECVC